MAVNVEPQGKVRFKITYEELLQRHLDIYQHIIHVNLDQVIDKLGCFEHKTSSETVIESTYFLVKLRQTQPNKDGSIGSRLTCGSDDPSSNHIRAN